MLIKHPVLCTTLAPNTVHDLLINGKVYKVSRYAIVILLLLIVARLHDRQGWLYFRELDIYFKEPEKYLDELIEQVPEVNIFIGRNDSYYLSGIGSLLLTLI